MHSADFLHAMKIVEASIEDKPKFEQLLDQYLAELKTYRDSNVGATDYKTYRYLDAYWNEKGRHPFLFYSENHLVGFSLIRNFEFSKSGCSHVAEFYVIPEKRLQGIGQKAAIAIFNQFPGRWELQIHCKNETAIRFWKRCILLSTKDKPSISKITNPDGKRLQYNFTVT